MRWPWSAHAQQIAVLTRSLEIVERQVLVLETRLDAEMRALRIEARVTLDLGARAPAPETVAEAPAPEPPRSTLSVDAPGSVFSAAVTRPDGGGPFSRRR
jgi:hypothetical protein